MMTSLMPQLSLRFIPVWRRNLLVWRKIMVPSVLGNFGEPVLYLLAFGYGFGQLVGDLGDLPYMVFLASGIICSSAMYTASFEGMYSAYTRMSEQKTWDGLLGAPLNLDDIVLGEIMWAATKALMSATAILVVAALLGLVSDLRALLALPVILLAGFAFAACAMIVTALSRSYDFFLYYFTLAITPMLLLSGVFFPLDQLPDVIVILAHLLPLVHVVEVVRPLMIGEWPVNVLLHLSVVAAYGLVALSLSTWLLRRRLMC
ncbi:MULTISPECIES: ABC transporter permease [Ectothiorhodospira]|uniref:ABC transporter permease n=1 Tax=Ectothiorhodospira TaxID=1051 RepID=UPI001EE7FF57|nr:MULTISPECIES: ABC transporter permease [Ectothiorhodospira]MCG5494872.1 ABC transporter permease [Ectothiorhodospira variabilis]MCG5497723.1 ABC transporter permease [Ectothiorhodospira variabilis]MCG5504385.1 ABC transporter permease [Ectothiorhodospira variabilis]MCG5507540.1 ABC transporter permease [Ectothiorhodospira variabilis]MCG5525210.1 ABC transporter permease [Ectothiorhodospira haloalkaliphila]